MPGYRSILLAVALPIAVAAPVGAQQMPPYPGASANVRESQQYDQALRSNPAFRAKRMQQECGPITDQQLHQQCTDSFQAYGPTSAPRKRQQ